MKSIFALLASVAILAFSTSSLCAQEYPMKPNEEHGILKADVGTWDAEIVMSMGPGTEPVKSKGVEKVRMLGEMWKVTDLEYEFMGQKVFGHGTIGYDPASKKYVGTWHESGSPYRSLMNGTYDAESKMTTFMMKSKDMTGADQDYKILMGPTGEGKRVFRLHMKPPGGDAFVEILTINYTKRK